MNDKAKPTIDIDIEVEVLEERIAPSRWATFPFGIRIGGEIRTFRIDHHAASGIRRAGSVSGAIFVKGTIGKGL